MLKEFAQHNVNKSTKVYLDSKFAELQLYFADDLDDEDLVSNSAELNKINTGFEEELISFMFVSKVSKNVEISVQLPTEIHRFNKIVHFPLLPETLYLADNTKDDLRDDIDLDNSRNELTNMMPVFFKEMKLNHNFAIRNKFWYIVSKNDNLNLHKVISWFVGLVINLLIFCTMELNEHDEDKGDRSLVYPDSKWKLSVMVLSFAYSVYNLVLFLIWLICRSTISQEINLMKYKIDHPFSSPESSRLLRWKIAFNTTFLNSAAAISFILHTIFAILGPLLDPVFHTLHLLLLVNISKPCLFILRATFKHFS